MSKICGYNCEHNKSGVCQISSCDKHVYITNNTSDISIRRKAIKYEIDNYKQALNEIREYVLNNSAIPRYKKHLAINDNSIFTGNINDILKIIDKVLGDEK